MPMSRMKRPKPFRPRLHASGVWSNQREQPSITAVRPLNASHVIKKAELDQLRMDRHGSLRLACLYPLAAHWILRNGDLFSARSPLDEILIC